MLPKKFKSSKCKTALNLAKSRIKLLKNKKGIQVNQLRREVAQLLQSGQDQTARIRVEHVVREEKTIAAFELIEIYCELVVARLPIVESQKNCPIDLKEAIASLIFAAPRCGDIPELQDVRKHFSAKYGKEFVAAATEIRPDCGVSRNLVEKLSVKAPDGPTKVKILTAIAEENNIKWEPNWFADEDPAPSIEIPKEQHMDKPGMIQMEPLNFEIADKVQHPHAYGAERSQTPSQSHTHVNTDVNEFVPSTSHPDGSYFDGKAFSHSSGNGVEAGRQNWTMEFKDATAAAQAAAESAERASMAARAAAELSRRSNANVVGEASSRPLSSSGRGWHEGNKVYAGSVLKDKHQDDDVANTSFNQRSPTIQVDQVGTYEQGHVTKPSTDYELQYGSKTEEYFESKNIPRPINQEVRQSRDSLPTQSAPEAKYDVFESPNQKYGSVSLDKPFYEEPTKIKIQHGSFESHSNSFGDVDNIFSNLNDRNKNSDDGHYSSLNQGTNNEDWHAKTAYDSGSYDGNADTIFTDQGEGDIFSSSDDQKNEFNLHKDTFGRMEHSTNEMDDIKEMRNQTDKIAVFDESGSDDNDEYVFDPAEKSYDISSPGKSSPKNSPFHQDSQSSFPSHPHHELDVSQSFRESPLYKKLSEPLPVMFDSDGESSESEREVQHEKTSRVIIGNDSGKHNSHPGTTTVYEESRTVYSDAAIKQRFDSGDMYTHQPSFERTSSKEKSHDLAHRTVYSEATPQKPPPSAGLSLQSSSDPASELDYERQAGQDGMELNFGLMPGGRRNRRQWDPPYRKGAIGDASSSPKSFTGSDGSPRFQKSSGKLDGTQISKKTSSLHTHFDSSVDDPEVVASQSGLNNAESPYNLRSHETTHKTWKDPTGYFYSDDPSSEDDTSNISAMTRTVQGAGISRRTKGSVARPGPSSQPSAAGEHVPGSNFNETKVSGTRPSRRIDNSRRDEAPSSRSTPQRKVSEDAYVSSSSVAQKQMTPKGSETARASDPNEKAPSRENSTKNPGHVHPNLPDFETFAARLQALRTNQQQ